MNRIEPVGIALGTAALTYYTINFSPGRLAAIFIITKALQYTATVTHSNSIDRASVSIIFGCVMSIPGALTGALIHTVGSEESMPILVTAYIVSLWITHSLHNTARRVLANNSNEEVVERFRAEIRSELTRHLTE